MNAVGRSWNYKLHFCNPLRFIPQAPCNCCILRNCRLEGSSRTTLGLPPTIGTIIATLPRMRAGCCKEQR